MNVVQDPKNRFPSPCESLRPTLHRLVDRELDPRESLRVQRHVEGCPGCSQHLQRLEAQDEVLRGAAPNEEDFPRAWSSILGGKLVHEGHREVGKALVAWVVARILERRGQRLDNVPTVTEAERTLQRKLNLRRALESSVGRPSRKRASVTPSGLESTIRQVRAVTGPRCPAIEWARILVCVDAGNLRQADQRLAQLHDTPPSVRQALQSWVSGTPVPVPLAAS